MDGLGKLSHSPRAIYGCTRKDLDVCKSSNAFAFVVLSFFERFLNATTTFGSEIEEWSGGSVT